jgi:hypothetical protein
MLKLAKISAIFCVAVVLALPCISKAAPLGTVDIAYTGPGAHDAIDIWAGSYEGITRDAGVYMLEKTGGTGEGNIWPNGPIGTFCIEWSEMASSSTLTYNVIMPKDGPLPTSSLETTMGATKAKYIQELWGKYFNPAWVGSCAFSDYYDHGAAAFSVAIWEIINEDLPVSPLGWDVMVDGTAGSRGFRAEYLDSSSIYNANSWLHSLNGTGPTANLRVFSYRGQQDFIIEVPEPATIALLGLGGMFGLLRKKRATT